MAVNTDTHQREENDSMECLTINWTYPFPSKVQESSKKRELKVQEWKRTEKNRRIENGREQFFLETTGKLPIRTHRGHDIVHKARENSRQTKPQYRKQ